MAKAGKRSAAAKKAFKEATEGKDALNIDEAVKLVKANANAKFDETVEIRCRCA